MEMKMAGFLTLLGSALFAAAAAASSPSPSPGPDCSSLQSLLSPCVSFVQSKQEESPTDECCTGLENVVSINSTCACDLEPMSAISGANRYNATLRLLDLPKLCSVVEFNPTSTCNIQVVPPPPSFSNSSNNDSSSSPSSVIFPKFMLLVTLFVWFKTLGFFYLVS